MLRGTMLSLYSLLSVKSPRTLKAVDVRTASKISGYIHSITSTNNTLGGLQYLSAHSANNLQKPRLGSTASTIRRYTTNKAWNHITVSPEIKRGKKQSLELDALLVRDSCHCSLCIDPSSQQKLFQTADIPSSISARDLKHGGKDKDGKTMLAALKWTDDIPGYPPDHMTILTTEQVEYMTGLMQPSSSLPLKPDLTLQKSNLAPVRDTRTPWTSTQMSQDVQWFDYSSYMRSDKTLFGVLEALRRYGLVFLRKVPDSIISSSTSVTPDSMENDTSKHDKDNLSVEQVANRIGPLRNSFYGTSWDVRSVPGAKNVAYTHRYLGMHMDLLYMTNPPRLQLLHCLRASSPGGTSLFSDTLAAANTFRRNVSPSLFSALCTFPVPYHYRNAGQYYRSTRPTIELSTMPLDFDGLDLAYSESGQQRKTEQASDGSDSSDIIANTNYSPPFQAPFSSAFPSSTTPAEFRAYHEAISQFGALLQRPDAVYEYRLREGELVIFDNRRIVHARTAFKADEGERWLKGAYVDGDVFVSRWRGLNRGSC